jgi:hypothetical protein
MKYTGRHENDFNVYAYVSGPSAKMARSVDLNPSPLCCMLVCTVLSGSSMKVCITPAAAAAAPTIRGSPASASSAEGGIYFNSTSTY